MKNTSNKIVTNNEVIIIGAGIAGLSAALELKAKNIKFKILEASDRAGGRIKTVTTKNGNTIDMGGQWLHGGMDNPLRKMVEHYNIPYKNDVVSDKNVVSYYGGERHVGTKFRDSLWQEEIKINDFLELRSAYSSRLVRNKAENGKEDCSLTDTVHTAELKNIMRRSSQTWGGTSKDNEASYAEFINDNSTVGGLQLNEGMKTLIDAMVNEIGKENIIYNASVTEITNKEYGVKITTKNSDIYIGKKAIFTGSVGVLKNNNIVFYPPHGKEMQEYLDGLMMAKFAKIVLEIKPDFFVKRPHLKNMHIDLFDKEPSIFCHVGSKGNSTISVMVGAEAAAEVEKMTPTKALEFAKKRLAKVVELQGYEQNLQGEPIVTSWSQDNNSLGSYSARKVGGKRNCGLQEGNILYAGEAFNDSWSCTMAGAYLSGKNATQKIIEQISKPNQILYNKSKNLVEGIE